LLSFLVCVDAEKGATQVQALDAPMISIGKGDAIIQVLPTALRFWEKLGLSPKGGRKDLSAFVLFEDEGEGREALVETWLCNVRSAYQVR
jgi:mediator of RNA polymerase II transcription subunit 13